jgi:hypothetical protein
MACGFDAVSQRVAALPYPAGAPVPGSPATTVAGTPAGTVTSVVRCNGFAPPGTSWLVRDAFRGAHPVPVRLAHRPGDLGVPGAQENLGLSPGKLEGARAGPSRRLVPVPDVDAHQIVLLGRHHSPQSGRNRAAASERPRPAARRPGRGR